MSEKTSVLTVVALFAWAGVACAGPGPLDLIPDDAAAGFAVRDLNDLKKKGDKFLTDADIKLPFRPSQLFEMGYQFLGIKAAVDEDAAAAIIIANPMSIGATKVEDALENLLVVAVPFTDRDKMAANFGIKAGDLKPDTLVPGNGGNFGKFFYARGNHVFLGNNDKAVTAVARGKPAGNALAAAQRRSLADADLLLHLGAAAWGDEWKQFLKSLTGSLDAKDEATEKAAHQLLETLESVRFGQAALRIDAGGLGLRLLAVFPKETNESARKFLAALQGGPGASDLAGLPDGRVLAAQAARGDGAETAAVVRLMFNYLLGNAFGAKPLLSAADRPTYLGVFTEVWKRLKGNRVAVYHNADEPKHGLLSVVAILDTDDAGKFLAELKELARLGDSAGLDLGDKAARKDDVAEVERLIRDLGDNRFAVRETASTKLALIGEPVLPYLEKALASKDPEVRRRAGDLKADIVAAAADRRKVLLSKDLTRNLKPTFAFAAKPEMLDGQEVEVVRVKVAARDAAAVSQLAQLFGPDWDRIRLAVQGKQVVALLGSDPTLLQTTLKNLKEGRPGLGEAKSLAAFARHSDPGRKVEFHVALQTALGLAAAEDLKQGGAAARQPPLTSFALTADPERLQLDVWLPSAEVKAVVKQMGW